MERADWSRLAHAGMDVMNPLPAAKLDELLDLLDLAAGARVVDLGCGKGDLLRRIATRGPVEGVGIDNSAALIAEARGAATPGLTFCEGDLTTFAATEPFELACAVGAGAGGGPVELLARLHALVRPGGLVLLGDGYWRRPPAAQYLDALGATADELPDLAGMVTAAEALGLVPLYAVTTSVEEFDRYEWRWALNGERYAAAHPDESGVGDFLEWIRNGRRRYLVLGGRDTLGFGLFLFRR
jgi:trans-aconitate methyltransferase